MVTATATPIRPVEETITARRPRGLLMIDPLLMLAALGLAAVLADHPARSHSGTAPGTLLLRRAPGPVRRRGVVLALVLSMIDYSRLREYKYVLFGPWSCSTWSSWGPRRSRGPPVDPAALLPVPVLGVRQDPADPGPGGVPGRPGAAAGRVANHAPDRGPGPAPGHDRPAPA